MLKCFAVVLFFLLSCGIVFADDKNSELEERCYAFLAKEGPTLGELQSELAECKKVFPPEFYAILEKAAINYTKEAVYEAQRDAVISVMKKANIKQVIDSIKRGERNLLSFEEYPYNPGAFQAVYVVDKKRYTVYYSGKEDGFLSFWVRPDGSSDQRLIQRFTDNGIDGKVEIGTNGDNQKFFDIESENSLGIEHQQYWQSLYDKAIEEALVHFK